MEKQPLTVEELKEFKEKKSPVIVSVQKTFHDEALDTDVLEFDLEGVRAIMPREEYDLRPFTNSLVPFVGRKMRVLVKDVTDEGLVVCSRKLLQEEKRNELVTRFLNEEVIPAKIVHFVKFGAYVEIDGVSMLLQNENFSTDYTSIREVHEIGDEIKVKLSHISQNGNLFAEAAEPYTSDVKADLSEFKRDQVVVGRIRNTKSFGVFVCIAPGLDALCPTPESEEVDIDSIVQFRITKVDEGEGRVRGKILRVLNVEEEEEIL